MNKELKIEFPEDAGQFTPVISVGATPFLRVPDPLRVCWLGSSIPAVSGYVSVESLSGNDDALSGWHVRTSIRRMGRALKFPTPGNPKALQPFASIARLELPRHAKGLRIEFRAATVIPGHTRFEDFEFFIPGALYKRNDTDHDGLEDYLGTYVQDFRDDRLANLAVLAYSPINRHYVALTRADIPKFDNPIRKEDLLSRHFIQDTDIGSLGLAPIDSSSQVWLRASYPFSEEFSYCLNTDRSGWAAYLENRIGLTMRISYRLHIVRSPSLTDAIWDITRRQIEALCTRPQKPLFSLQQSLDWRLELTQQYYRKWSKAENVKEPAGYMVHFSPRSGETMGALLEYGFSGAQTLLAYVSLVHSYQKGNPLWRKRACQVNDFFVNHANAETGFVTVCTTP